MLAHLRVRKRRNLLVGERLLRNLHTADRLHERFLKVRTDGHDLPRRLHLRPEETGSVEEFIKGPFGELHHHVVERGLETGVGLFGNRVFDFVERVADGNLGRNLCNRVTRRLRGERGGARNTGIDLDDRILEGIGIERELTVAPALDLELGDDIDGGTAEHLIFLVRERHRGRDDDAVPRMYAHRVEVFHGANGDHVALAVPHDLELDFLPARNTLFNKYLCDRRKTQTVCCNLV